MTRGALVVCSAMLPAALLASLPAGCQLAFPTVAAEAGADADAGPYPRLDDRSAYEAYVLPITSPFYRGGAFDGRYVYFAPAGGPVARYDTHGAFTDQGSWSSFDPFKQIGPQFGSDFIGAVFDGRWVYFIGSTSDGNFADATMVRLDPTKPFSDKSAWTPYDATAHDPKARSFAGGAFDGRYVYFAPELNDHLLRFDTKGSFEDAAAWTGFDIHDAAPSAAGSAMGAVFDGQYVYFPPFKTYPVAGPADAGSDAALIDAGVATVNGVLARFDTSSKAGLGAKASWESYDLMSVDPSAGGLAGGAFDGRYVYFAPYISATGVTLRYDTRAPGGLGSKDSWKSFALTTVSNEGSGFLGAAYDGRYIYLVPYQAAVMLDGVLFRYDTTSSRFDLRSAWEPFFDLTQVEGTAQGYFGAVFDGQYIYLVPDSTGVVIRFEARSSNRMPKLPGFFGSFL